MGSLGLALDEHIIHIHLHISSDLIFEDFIHEVLVGYTCMFRIKKYHPVTKKPSIINKGDLILIFRCHLNLVIVGEGIHEGQEFMI